MADEFQTSGNWWDSCRATRFEAGTATSPSSSALNSFGWENNNNNNSNNNNNNNSNMESSSLQASDNSNLHMVGLGLSNSQAMDWNHHALFRGDKAAPEGSFRAILHDNMGSNSLISQDHNSGNNSSNQTAQIQWRSSSSPPNQHHQHHHHHVMNRGFSLDPQAQFSPQYSSGDSTVTCQGLTSSSFNLDSALYASPSAILQGLFGPDPTQQQQQASSNPSLTYNSPNFTMNSNEILGSSTNNNNNTNSWSNSGTNATNNNSNKLPQFLRSTNSPPKVASYSNNSTSTSNNHLQFSNNAPFWNAPETAVKDVRAGSFFSTLQPPFPATTFEEKPKNISEVRDSSSVAKKSGNEVASNKRSRSDQTTSTLPAFKVRKEKMGDRITALQQLVSPFGKTDTASVLSEAIEYIKFLHDQVSVLSTPYMKSGTAIQHQQINADKSKDPEELKQDLRSRGLCLVPVSSTLPVTHETTVDFWTPTFGGTYR